MPTSRTDDTKHTYDLIVIGAGSGGLVAAEVAAGLGAKVALVEASNTLGGECLHTGCVPSKALIHGARNFEVLRDQITDWQTHAEPAYQKARTSIKKSIQHIQDAHDNDAFYQSKGVDVYHGKAQFSSPNQIELQNNTNDPTTQLTAPIILQAKRFILATGSRPFVPPIPGLSDCKYLTNESVFEVETLPESLIIIGGGPIGCELGQAFAMFGTQVTILSQDTHLLPRDEPEAGAALQASLATYDNVQVIFETKITEVSQSQPNPESTETKVVYTINDQTKETTAEQVLVATGRTPNTDLNLEAAAVAYTNRAITVNARAQTTNKHVYAIGDVAGGPNFTHVAADQAVIAVQNALFGLRRKKRSPDQLIWASFTTPEIAHLGADEATLQKNNTLYKVGLLNFSDIDKAVADAEPGLIKLLLTPKGHILGATIIGGPASELISILAVAKHQKMTFTKLGDVLQAYPTYAFGLRAGAGTASLEAFQNGPTRTVANLLRRINLH